MIVRMKTAKAFAVAFLLVAPGVASLAEAQPAYSVLGQPNLAGTTLASRCPGANARFNRTNDGGFVMHGPSGIAVDPRGRLFVTDFGGKRVLTWPNFSALTACRTADGVIPGLAGPE